MYITYHIPFNKLAINSDQDYAEYYLAITSFGENHPIYKNGNLLDFILGCDGYEYDCFINRNGICWLIIGDDLNSDILNKILESIISKSEFPSQNYKKLINEQKARGKDSAFQILQNLFAKRYLADGQIFPTKSLDKLIGLAAKIGVERKFNQLKLISKDVYKTDNIPVILQSYTAFNSIEFIDEITDKFNNTLLVYQTTNHIPLEVRSTWMKQLATSFETTSPLKIVKSVNGYYLLAYANLDINLEDYKLQIKKLFETPQTYQLLPKDFTEM
jgi:hypothetical protein